MAHTSGPWTADWDDGGQWYVNIGGLHVTGTALRGDSGKCVESANAHLISAAPDLLAALKYFFTAWNQGAFEGSSKKAEFSRDIFMGAAKAAISKAEGKSQ